MSKILHDSDCAIYNEPALPAGPCDCGAAGIEHQAAEIATLQAALEPFQRNIEAAALSGALGHISRDHLWAARKAYETILRPL